MSSYENSDWIIEAYDPDDGNKLELAQELYDKGLLFLANQNALHHYGYALGVMVDDETGKVTSLCLFKTDDPDGVWFDEESIIEGRKKLKNAM